MTAVVLALLLAAEPVRVPGVVDLKNKADPVDGKKAKVLTTVDWHGLRIRFASEDNAAKFKKDPGKYCSKLGLKLVAKEKVVDLQNKKCPVTGKKVDTHLDRDGVRFRVAGAQKKFDAAKACQALGYGYVPPVIDLRNKQCPVTGDECYPEAPIWVDLDGIRIRVCCDHCVKEAREFKKRIFQALMVDPAKLKKRLR